MRHKVIAKPVFRISHRVVPKLNLIHHVFARLITHTNFYKVRETAFNVEVVLESLVVMSYIMHNTRQSYKKSLYVFNKLTHRKVHTAQLAS